MSTLVSVTAFAETYAVVGQVNTAPHSKYYSAERKMVLGHTDINAMKVIRGFALSVMLAASLTTVCAQDSILVELLASKYDGLVNLFEHAGLFESLESNIAASRGGVTIFAPTDFYLMHRVSHEVLGYLRKEENAVMLRNTLMNHVIVGKVDATAWSPSKTVMTLAHSESRLFLDGAELRVEGAVVRELNALKAIDGVVHAINGFLLPKDVEKAIAQAALLSKVVMIPEIDRRIAMATTAMAPMSSPPSAAPGPMSEATLIIDALTAAGNFSTFIGLVKQYGLISRLNVLAAKGHPITLFAPTNQAFNKLVYLESKASQLVPSVVEKILLYHLVVGGYSYQQLKQVGMGAMVTPAISLKTTSSGGTILSAEGMPLQVTTMSNDVYLGPYPPGALVHPKSILSTKAAKISALDEVLIPPGLFSAPAPAPSSGAVSMPASGTMHVVTYGARIDAPLRPYGLALLVV